MLQKAYDILGLAQRAGQIQSGDAAAEAVIKKGRAKLLLLAKDASEGTKEHFIRLAKFRNVKYMQGGEKLHLGIALGRSPRSVVVVTEEGFARRLGELFGGDEENF